jgi:hypothetical protein
VSEVDTKTFRVLLACLDLEVNELADHMGYDARYVSNVVNGCTKASPAFRRAFGETIGTLVFGTYHPGKPERYPSAPLLELIQRRAADATSKRDFYRHVGVNAQSLKENGSVSGLVVDRICCALGVHPSAVYGDDYSLAEAS